MRKTAAHVDEPRIRQALDTLKDYISRRYPGAEFTVTEGEDPAGIYLVPLLDIDDPHELYNDEFCDLLLDLYGEDGLPLYVFPNWPRERELAELKSELEHKNSPAASP